MNGGDIMLEAKENKFVEVAEDKIRKVIGQRGVVMMGPIDGLKEAILEIGKLYHDMEEDEQL
jgi:hypothetical protein